ncbi:Argonaute siRNA chaperone complex subunit Arb1-domain-containing protein [Cokeromyces recurvatus]|uniref:Argonaute siRNA chaperone complex subunit Arb1-domain-containing protein n=1 Tax=Cokeromyces recurvatus TaxID=90255 RepID=UPI00221FC1FE|nr:Argonaute siRNA chaperone complex subunit Arb1-domain-containing protein [Cokeromyces recurvatus]KAI7903749.1 Argonaute siRNA chaperone complex subunit Arb1-domain-containing protein [Cokeromyces recurvatus]
MENLSTQEEREQFIDEFLDKVNIEENSNELLEEDEDGQQIEEDIAYVPTGLATPVSVIQKNKTEQQKEKKKKKKKKSKTSNLPEAGSELPDDYVEKHPEDLIDDPYDPENPLSQRVEYAIWKYRKNHKFTDERRSIFDNYLRFGGIKTGPNMFLGRATSADAPDDPDAAIDFEAAKTAIDSVPDELEEGMEVNFTEVAQVYLGNTFIRESRFISLQNFIDAPNLIDAFLRYLQIRRVAPEYEEDIANARAICAQAKIQLPMCKKVSSLLPGKYNTACADVFGALDSEMDVSWMTETTLKIQKQFMSFVSEKLGSNEEAKKIVQSRIKNFDSVKLLETQDWVFVQVSEISPYNEETGPDDLVQVILKNCEDTQDTYSVLLEKKIVENLMVGMVARVTLCKLSNGEWYLQSATRIMPTFYMEDDCMTEEDYDY